MSSKIDVSVIIVNYNTFNMTNECVDSICKFTSETNYEIIIVDNASTDQSKEFFSNDERIIYIYNTENLGFGKANNLGLKNASGKYIFFLNSDTLLLNDAISMFFHKLENSDDSVACIGAILLDAKGNRTHSYGAFPSFGNELISNTFLSKILLKNNIVKSAYDDTSLEKDDFFPVDYIIGADLFVRKKVLDQLGGFDPDFFMYYEESELQRRFSKHNYNSFILKGPEIIHLEGASIKSDVPSLRKRIIGITGCLLYFKKTESKVVSFLFKTFLAILSLPILFNKKYPMSDRKKYIKVLAY